MQTREIALGIAATTVIVAGGLALLARSPSVEPPPVAPSNEPLTIAVSDAPALRAAAPSVVHEAQAAAKIRELEAMSETFRNSTFVIAIRDAGYVCNELLRVYGGIDDSGKWTATCSEMMSYTVAVASNGTLRVEPMLQYFDGLSPAIIDRQNIVPAPPPPPRTPPPR